MFIITLGRKGIKKVAIVAVCCVLLICTTIAAGNLFPGNTAQSTPVMASTVRDYKVESVDDVAILFESFGVGTDITTAEVTSVSVPKKFDETFTRFNEILKESGGDLSRNRGSVVEKWRIVSPGESVKDEVTWAVALVRDGKALGCYFLSEPSGQVKAITNIAGAE